MTNNKTTYRRLGDYIREVDVRNKDLQCTNLLGLSIAKKFIPSIANMVGTDLRPYKIVKHNQFAYVPVTSRNGEKITVALYTDDEPAIISQAYVVFEIVGTCDIVETVCTPSLQCDQLLPEYLMMWFRRAEFDRYARYHSHGSAREVFDWEEMCNVMLPVPSIEEQRRIVDRYNAIKTRIENNKQTIAKLEEAAQALYRKMFVDGIDVENLPEGWRMGTIGEVAEITMGQSPDGSTYNEKGEGMIFYQGRTDYGYRFPSIRMYTTSPTRMAKLGDVLLSVRAPVGDLNIAPHDCCIGRGLAALRSKIGCNSFIYYLLQTKEHDFNVSNEDGTVFGSITKDDLFGLSVVIPDEKLVVDFDSKAKILDNDIKLLDNEINKLTEMLLVVMAE